MRLRGTGDDLDLRLTLFASQVAGLLVTREILALPPLRAADIDALVEKYTRPTPVRPLATVDALAALDAAAAWPGAAWLPAGTGEPSAARSAWA